jgi:beta-lactamase regulating signal transducer with metallopeptidase domain
MGFLFEGRALALLCEYLIKSSVILSASIAMVFLLRKKSACLRHLILSVLLIGLLFLPFLSMLSTGWETNFLPSWEAKNVTAMEFGAATRDLSASTSSVGDSNLPSEFSVHAEGFDMDSRSAMGTFLSRLKPVFGFAAFLIWIGGLLFLFVRIGLGLYGTNRLMREGQNIEDSLWRRLLFRFFEAVSLRQKKINLMSHEKTLIPLTWGVIKPVVMMPAESCSWSENQRSTALYHELSHIKRGDYLVMILARISRAVYWFNPLGWIVLGMIKREQEKACDELVLKAGIKPSTYAENLLLIRNSVSGHWNPPAAVLGAMSKSHLNDRLTTILKQRFDLKEVQMKTKVLLVLLTILSISFIGLARPGDTSSSHADAVAVEHSAVTTQVDSQDSSDVVQEQEKKEQKKEIKKGVKIEDKEKEKTTLVLTTKEGDEKTFKIIFDKDDPKKAIFVTSPKVKLDKGEKLTWTIKGDKLHVSNDMKTIKLDEGTAITIDKEGKDGVKVITLVSPHIQVKKIEKDPEYVKVHVHTSPHVEVNPSVHVVIDTDKYAELIEKIKDKLAKLKAKALDSDVKEVELKAIEEALEELQKALEKKHEKTEHVAVSVQHKDSHSYKIRTKDIHLDHAEGISAVGIMDDKGAFSIIFKAEFATDQKEAYEKAIRKLESNLPEDYSLDSAFDDDEGTLTLKIKKAKKEGEEDKKAVISLDEIKELIEEFKKDLEKIKK